MAVRKSDSMGLSCSLSQDLAVTTTTPHSPPVTMGTLENTLSIDQELAAVEISDVCGNWDLAETVVITCGPPGSIVKCMTIVPPALTLWVASGSDVLVIDTTGLQKLAS